jgi:hypothetical protein
LEEVNVELSRLITEEDKLAGVCACVCRGHHMSSLQRSGRQRCCARRACCDVVAHRGQSRSTAGA